MYLYICNIRYTTFLKMSNSSLSNYQSLNSAFSVRVVVHREDTFLIMKIVCPAYSAMLFVFLGVPL